MKTWIFEYISNAYRVKNIFRRLLASEKRSAITPGKNLDYTMSQYYGADTKIHDVPCLFISARFRTGSTFLWQLLSLVEELTPYYEPFNERKWVCEVGQNTATDPSHLGVKNYTSNYEGLSALASLHSTDWAYKKLWMDEHSFDLNMEQYVRGLVEKAKGFPVLQFNRADFRLRWLRKNFPACKILHLVRNPRNQWLSSLRGQTMAHDIALKDFQAYDRFYLLPWADDLKDVFPALALPETAPAYLLFYILNRLSEIYGQQEGDLTIQYEQLAANPMAGLQQILDIMGLTEATFEALEIQKMTQPSPADKWKKLAPASWFEDIEGQGEIILRQTLSECKPPLPAPSAKTKG